MEPRTPEHLFDLLRERYIELRSHIEKKWNSQSDFTISTTAWSVIAFIYKRKTTIANVTRYANIGNLSRQAIHKIIKNLESKKLVNISDSPDNKKEKCIELTPLGEASYDRFNEIKRETEKEILDFLGKQQFNILINLLNQQWKNNNA